MNLPYHSALSNGKLEDASPLMGVFEYEGSAVFPWDINAATLSKGIPEPYYSCDVIYAEPAWPSGLAAFDQRAGVTSPPFSVYAQRLGYIIRMLGKPSVMFASDRALSCMPPADFVTDAGLNGNRTKVGFWNGAYALGNNNHEFIRDLASRYNRVGDFCCGYGTTGRLFREAGKTFVMSDYNTVCCGYVAREMKGWGSTS